MREDSKKMTGANGTSGSIAQAIPSLNSQRPDRRTAIGGADIYGTGRTAVSALGGVLLTEAGAAEGDGWEIRGVCWGGHVREGACR